MEQVPFGAIMFTFTDPKSNPKTQQRTIAFKKYRFLSYYVFTRSQLGTGLRFNLVQESSMRSMEKENQTDGGQKLHLSFRALSIELEKYTDNGHVTAPCDTGRVLKNTFFKLRQITN